MPHKKGLTNKVSNLPPGCTQQEIDKHFDSEQRTYDEELDLLADIGDMKRDRDLDNE